MPTGTALQDARHQLFAAAERALIRHGAGGLTSRAVTDEAGCAKGVLHRHFADFDSFLAELVEDRIQVVNDRGAALLSAVGTGPIDEVLTEELMALFGPVTLDIVGLVTSRSELRTRLRQITPTGIPLLAEGTGAIGAYLSAEREAGRIAADADTSTLAVMLVGSAHLVLAGQRGEQPDRGSIRAVVTAVIRPALTSESS